MQPHMIFSGLAALFISSSFAAESRSPLETARAHVAAIRGSQHAGSNSEELQRQVEESLQGRDPKTSATSFLHGIKRRAGRLLTKEQAKRWNELLDGRQPELKRLHDERNVLRGFFFAKAWELPLLEGEARMRAEADLKAWLGVWLDLTLWERIAQHRLCRDAWEILDADQRAAIARGDWDRHVKKSMGHKRAYFGDRIVSRALGKPGNAAAFEQHSATLAKEHAPVRERLLEAERRWRILTFAQPPVSDDLLAAEWSRTSAALGAFFLTQADHQERLSRAGYDLDHPAVRARVAARPAAELATLAENVRKKLTAGKAFHAELIATMENAGTPKRK